MTLSWFLTQYIDSMCSGNVYCGIVWCQPINRELNHAEEIGQGHVHTISNCGVGQRKLTNRCIV